MVDSYKEARMAELTLSNLISNKREWNYCFIKFNTLVCYRNFSFIFWERSEVDVTTTSLKSLFVNLFYWKIWKRSDSPEWKLQLTSPKWRKDITFAETLKNVEVTVIEKSCNCKNTAKNFDRYVTQTFAMWHRRCVKMKLFPRKILLLAVTNLPLKLDVWSWLLTNLISELGFSWLGWLRLSSKH